MHTALRSFHAMYFALLRAMWTMHGRACVSGNTGRTASGKPVSPNRLSCVAQLKSSRSAISSESVFLLCRF